MKSWGQIAGIPLLVLVDGDGTVLETYQGIGDLSEIDRRLTECRLERLGEPLCGEFEVGVVTDRDVGVDRRSERRDDGVEVHGVDQQSVSRRRSDEAS